MEEALKLASQFGPLGLIIGYLIIRESAERKVKEADIASREKLASSLAALSLIISGKTHV